ncbi:hypothetical protein CEXT_148111 [Caerostris extrusa]|uniref:Uncharacterized protein n=1 Tax=Caerostris extrusa TaxID=172846 RepID=A0AAV4S9H4_CAEEX|nr:hypothetical protein CEXT_148111 [Caerostris extrusa]
MKVIQTKCAHFCDQRWLSRTPYFPPGIRTPIITLCIVISANFVAERTLYAKRYPNPTLTPPLPVPVSHRIWNCNIPRKTNGNVSNNPTMFYTNQTDPK